MSITLGLVWFLVILALSAQVMLMKADAQLRGLWTRYRDLEKMSPDSPVSLQRYRCGLVARYSYWIRNIATSCVLLLALYTILFS